MPIPTTTLSLRGFARLIAVDEAAVRKAIHLGRLGASVVQTPRGPKIADVALARREWQENANPVRRLAAGQPVDLEPRAAEPLAAAWTRYVDGRRAYEARVEAAYLEALTAAGVDPERIPPWPPALRSWARVAEAELAALDAFGALADALEAAGVGITGTARPSFARQAGRTARR